MPEPLKILFLAPEAVPFAKTGGLADVAGSLPGALAQLGADVRLVLPLYRAVRDQTIETRALCQGVEIPLGNLTLKADIRETGTEEGIPVYFVEREDMYDRPNLYGTGMGDYYDNLERFAFFSCAALQAAQSAGFMPDLIHCHDWQTGLVPALLKGPFGRLPFFRDIRTVFTIHNLGYQGLFPQEKLEVTGLPRETFFHPEGVEYWGKISLLKAGVVCADAITTVSPAYAREIQTPEFGLGMDGILHRRRAAVHGILNGADYRTWDPLGDPHLPENYSHKKLRGKGRCKESLLQEMGLDQSLQGRPLLGMVSRLDRQKGLDLLLSILNDLFSLDVGLVILGSGDDGIQTALSKARMIRPERVGLRIGFDEALAHRIMAGVDILLIPSRYEPCGLTQMYALRYGTVPVVRATGGLEDTIESYDSRTGKGNGFKFGPYEPTAFSRKIREAVECFDKPGVWERVRLNGMKADFSWNRSASRYMDLYRSLGRYVPEWLPRGG
jgi:starch synthase